MEINKTLESIGLQKQEVNLYLSLLQNGHSTIAELARRTNLHRPYVYKVLPHLIQKGIVTKGPFGKRTLYMAESPDKLKSTIESIKNNIDEIIPTLKDMQHSHEKRPLVKYLDGDNGVKAVFEDLITSVKKSGTYYRYSSAKEDVFKSKSYLPSNYREVQERKELYRLIITNEEQAGTRSKEKNIDLKIIPKSFDAFDDNIVHLIYSHKVAFIDYNSETAVIIESKRFADFQKKIFLMLYRKL